MAKGLPKSARLSSLVHSLRVVKVSRIGRRAHPKALVSLGSLPIYLCHYGLNCLEIMVEQQVGPSH